MNPSDFIFHALAPVGETFSNYKHTDTVYEFVESLWSEKTLQTQPSNEDKDQLLELFKTLSMASSCVYGVPKTGFFPRTICIISASASAFNFFVSSMISHLSAIPDFLNDISTNIDNIILRNVTEGDFYASCISLIRHVNIIRLLVKSADSQTYNFKNTIVISPLSQHVEQLCSSTNEIIGQADQLKNSILNQTASTQDVITFKNTLLVFCNIIPQYTQVYTNLLLQLHDSFNDVYEETEYNDFVKYLNKLVFPIYELVLLTSEIMLQKPLECKEIIEKLQNISDNVNIILLGASKLMHFRCQNLKIHMKEIMNSQSQISPLFQEIITNFITVLSSIPCSLQKYFNNSLKENLNTILTINSQFQEIFDPVIKKVKSDRRSTIFSSISKKHIGTPLGTQSFQTLVLLNTISHKLFAGQFTIESHLKNLLPLITGLFELIDHSINNSKGIRGKMVLTQKKIGIQTSLGAFIESIKKVSIQQEEIVNCALKSILLSHSISSLDVHTLIPDVLADNILMISEFSNTFFIQNEKYFYKIIDSLRRNVEFSSKSCKTQVVKVIESLVETIKEVKPVFDSRELLEKDLLLQSENERQIGAYEKLGIVFSSLQYLLQNESFGNNNINYAVNVFQQAFSNLVISMRVGVQTNLYQNTLLMSKVFERLLHYIDTSVSHFPGSSNYKNIVDELQNRNRIFIRQLKKCGIGFDRNCFITLLTLIPKYTDEFKQSIEMIRTSFKSNFFNENLESSYSVFNSVVSNVEQLLPSLRICDIHREITQKSIIAPILSHYTISVNNCLDKYVNELKNKSQYLIQFSLYLTETLYSLKDHILYIPEAKATGNRIGDCGWAIFQNTTLHQLGTDKMKTILEIIRILLKNLSLLVPFTLNENNEITKEIIPINLNETSSNANNTSNNLLDLQILQSQFQVQSKSNEGTQDVTKMKGDNFQSISMNITTKLHLPDVEKLNESPYSHQSAFKEDKDHLINTLKEMKPEVIKPDVIEQKVINNKVEDNKVEDIKVEDNKVEDIKVEDNKVEDNKVEDNKVEDNKVEDIKVEDNKVGDIKVEDNKVEDNKVEDNKVEDNKVEDIKVEDNKVGDIKVEDNKVEDNKVEDNKVGDIKVEDIKVEDIKVEDNKVEDDKVEDIKVEDIKVEDNKVEYIKVGDIKVEDIKVEDNKVEDNKVGDIKVEDIKVEDNKVEDDKVEDDKVEDNKVEDNKVGDIKVEDIKVEDDKVEDNKVEDNKVEDNKVGDIKVEDIKVEDIKVEDDKVEDNKVEDNKVGDIKVEDIKVEDNKVEDDKVEDDKVEDNKVEDNKVEDNKVGDIKVEDIKVEDIKVEDIKVEDDKVEDIKVEDNKVEDNKVGDIKVEDNKVENIKVEDNKVGDIKVEDNKVENIKVEDNKVEDDKVEDNKVEYIKVEDNKVEYIKVEDNKVEDNKVEDDKVEDDKVEDNKVGDIKVEDNKVENIKVEDNKVEDDKVEDNKVEYIKVEDNKVEYIKVEDNKVEDNKVEDDKVEDDKVEDNKVEDNKVEDNKVEDIKVEDNKVEDDKVGDNKAEDIKVEDNDEIKPNQNWLWNNESNIDSSKSSEIFKREKNVPNNLFSSAMALVADFIDDDNNSFNINVCSENVNPIFGISPKNPLIDSNNACLNNIEEKARKEDNNESTDNQPHPIPNENVIKHNSNFNPIFNSTSSSIFSRKQTTNDLDLSFLPSLNSPFYGIITHNENQNNQNMNGESNSSFLELKLAPPDYLLSEIEYDDLLNSPDIEDDECDINNILHDIDEFDNDSNDEYFDDDCDFIDSIYDESDDEEESFGFIPWAKK